jgi:hypothetical protein
MLHDFKVRVLTPSRGAAAKVRVLVESDGEKKRYAAVSVSENIIEASFQLLVDSLE